MSVLEHPSVSTVAAVLREAGMAAAADGIRILDDEVRTAALAARALGVSVGAIANSLVFRAVLDDGDTALLALTSGAHRADPDRLAELIGARRVIKADPAFVREHTGQAIGGVAPVGHPWPVRTLCHLVAPARPIPPTHPRPRVRSSSTGISPATRWCGPRPGIRSPSSPPRSTTSSR